MDNEENSQQADLQEEEIIVPSETEIEGVDENSETATHDIEQKMLEKELKNQRIHHQLLELFLQKDGLGKAASTALTELNNLAQFDLDDDGKVVIIDNTGEVVGTQGGKNPVESLVEKFLSERDYLVASKWNNRIPVDEKDLAAQLHDSGGSRKGRLDLGRSLTPDDSPPSEYDFDQESAERYIRRRTLELENTSNSNRLEDNKSTGISSKKGRLRIAKTLLKENSD